MESAPPASITPAKQTSRVIALNRLSEFGFELVLERGHLIFHPGQLINLHGRNHLEDRSYTICSGERDAFLAVLFRHIPAGILTPRLVSLKPGDPVELSGPYGEFVVRDKSRPLVFFATGTGVAPCRAYLRSFPGLDLTLVHGVRKEEDLFYRAEFNAIRYHPCVSDDPRARGIFHGRVTDLARTAFRREGEAPAEPGCGPEAFLCPAAAPLSACHYYLCGANEMIYELSEWLQAQGVDRSAIFSEEYYYRSDDA